MSFIRTSPVTSLMPCVIRLSGCGGVPPYVFLETGGNVVLDWGLWSREERDHYRTEAQALGAQVVLCVLDPPIGRTAAPAV